MSKGLSFIPVLLVLMIFFLAGLIYQETTGTEFLGVRKGCVCSQWVDNGCGLFECSSTEMQQYRTCAPANCKLENRCVQKNICVPGCKDSDGGVKYFTRGAVKGAKPGFLGLNEPYFELDRCINGKRIGMDDEYYTGVREFFCVKDSPTPGEYGFIEYECPEVCENGACVQPSTSYTCTDSDGGKDASIKGTITFSGPNDYSDTVSDECISDTRLLELYCSSPTAMVAGSVNIDCSLEGKICKDGTCVKRPRLTVGHTPSNPVIGDTVTIEAVTSITLGYIDLAYKKPDSSTIIKTCYTLPCKTSFKVSVSGTYEYSADLSGKLMTPEGFESGSFTVTKGDKPTTTTTSSTTTTIKPTTTTIKSTTTTTVPNCPYDCMEAAGVCRAEGGTVVSGYKCPSGQVCCRI